MTFDITNWMNLIDGDKKLSELSIPGTHDSGSRAQESLSTRLTTQSRTLSEQLEAGTRFLDIRVRYIKRKFRMVMSGLLLMVL